MSAANDPFALWDALVQATKRRDQAEQAYNLAHADWRDDESKSNAAKRQQARRELQDAHEQQRRVYQAFHQSLERTGLLTGGKAGLRRYLETILADTSSGVRGHGGMWYRTSARPAQEEPPGA